MKHSKRGKTSLEKKEIDDDIDFLNVMMGDIYVLRTPQSETQQQQKPKKAFTSINFIGGDKTKINKNCCYELNKC